MIKTEAISNLRKKLADSTGFFSQFKHMGASCLELVENRLNLLSVELETQKLRLTAMIIAGMAALFFLGFGILFTMFTLIVIFWDSGYRDVVLGFISIIFLLLGVWFLIVAKQQLDLSAGAFKNTLRELKQDKQALNGDE